eukprot:TRINITY_DN2053_c0_g1_i1.p1 TRINITY_DN2053_c0_g1~~TRINITY_DN2053_c0_g1_i1.p1  ORF type:complete len:231 (+),score=72.70 TRINITY_DN2053_c0_g1_i1:224-916(+)
MLNGLLSENDGNEKAMQLSKKTGSKIKYLKSDISIAQSCKDLVLETNKVFGNGPHILVNNAGIQHVSPIEEFSDNMWEKVIAINLSSVFYTTKTAIPFMKKEKWGRIINISSVHGLIASKDKSAYVASKHGVVGFTKTIALELAGSGITSNTINPGWVKTDLVNAQIKKKSEELKITIEEATDLLLREKQPSRQFVNVEDIGNFVVFLCSPSGNQMTGSSYLMDGGWVAC